MHEESRGVERRAVEKSSRLDEPASGRFLCGVLPLLAAETVRRFEFDLSAYPRWLVVLVGTLVLAFVLYIVMKLLKWTMWILVFGVLAGGIAWAGWLLLKPLL